MESEIQDYYDKKLEVADTAYEDEAIEYGKCENCISAFSLCLPSDDNDDDYNMHTDKPVKIKRNAFSEYIEAVAAISHGLSEFVRSTDL